MKLPRPICINCKKEFDLKEESIPFYLESKAKGMVFIMVDCSNCNRTTGFNPSEPEKSNLKKESPVWRTPVSGINGFVSFIEEADGESFYGCGEFESGEKVGLKLSLSASFKSTYGAKEGL